MCAMLFLELTEARAWEKAANAGLSDAVLETQLKLYSPFIRKLALHDLWLPHRCGQVPLEPVLASFLLNDFGGSCLTSQGSLGGLKLCSPCFGAIVV